MSTINSQSAEIMVDIETLSTQTDALILTIAAIRFDRNNIIKDMSVLSNSEKFYFRINKPSCVNLGMHIDSSTVKWWSTQSKEAQYEVFFEEDNRVDIKYALEKLIDFSKGCTHFWSNSPNFDYVILENAFKKCGIDAPWKFWQLRDTRTVYDLASIRLASYTSGTLAHHALVDCHNQIIALQDSIRSLSKKRKSC